MKRLTFILLLAAAVFNANAQTEEYITLGITGGIVKNINGIPKDTNDYGNVFKDGIPGYNVGFDFGIRTSAKTRFRMELKHTEFHYKALWDTTRVPATNVSPIYETRVKVWNMHVALRCDYKYLETEKWKLFVSPGLLWEFNLDREAHNLKRPYNNPLGYTISDYSFKRYLEIAYENPNHILGGSVQFLCKYKISKHVALTINPEYYIFFRGVIRQNYGHPYQRLTLNGGLEFNF